MINLADFQENILNIIYQLLVDSATPTFINLYSEMGSGKTTIAKVLIERLLENWKIFFIEGISNNLSPYMTWYIGTGLHSTKKHNINKNLSFGVSVIPVTCIMEFGVPYGESKSYILSSNEESILKSITKQSFGNENILIIADNYEAWDEPSKQLLQKLMINKLRLLNGYSLNVLILSHSKISTESDIAFNYLTINNLNENDILFILNQNGFSGFYDLANIKSFSGKNLHLALMSAEYYDDSKGLHRETEILEKRINSLSKSEQDMCKTLEKLSIVNSIFSIDETAFFMSLKINYNSVVEYKAEECLKLASEQDFIKGEDEYQFTNEIIKKFFYSKLSIKAKYLHKDFSEYLKLRHPEDYLNRAFHLEQYINKNDINTICQTWQLYFLAYVRIANTIGWDKDEYKCIDKIKKIIGKLNTLTFDIQNKIFHECMEGFRAFASYNYRDALLHLQSIHQSQLCISLRAEILRILSLCYIQLAESRTQVQESADNLYSFIECQDFDEDEQYCSAALVLLDAYVDKSNHLEKVQILKEKFVRCVSKHLNSPTFIEFNACFSRKSALYYSAIIAYNQTIESCNFYRNNNNIIGLYMSSCNCAANAIVCGKYDSAHEKLKECVNLVKNNPDKHFPSEYKIENNELILQFLVEEQNNFQKIPNLSKIIETKLFDLSERDEDEVSFVAYLNYLSLAIINNSDNWLEELNKANEKLSEIDEFYQFYLHDLNFAAALLNQKFDNAKKEMDFLQQIDVPLLQPYGKIFGERTKAQLRLLKSKNYMEGNPNNYDRYIRKYCAHIQDASCEFYGRGFLLSDLQFLSF